MTFMKTKATGSDLGEVIMKHATYSEIFEDVSDIEMQVEAQTRYKQELIRHPDCRDPDHPGCSKCDEGFDDE